MKIIVQLLLCVAFVVEAATLSLPICLHRNDGGTSRYLVEATGGCCAGGGAVSKASKGEDGEMCLQK